MTSLGEKSSGRGSSPSAFDDSAHVLGHASVVLRSAHTVERSSSFVDQPTELMDNHVDCTSGNRHTRSSCSGEVNSNCGSCSSSSSSSFASQPRVKRRAAYPAVFLPTKTDVFTAFCEHTVAKCFQQHVSHLLESLPNTGPVHGSFSGQNREDPNFIAEKFVSIVHALASFLETVHGHAIHCFPDDMDLIPLAHSAVQDALQDVILQAAEDKQRLWTYQGYMDLVLAIHQLLDLCRTLKSCQDFAAHIDGDLRVVYTSMGNLAHQFLMLSIDGATRDGVLSLTVDSQDSIVCFPDCIELLRMMHQQVKLAAAVRSSPLLHLVSSGCHSAMATLQSRLHRLFSPLPLRAREQDRVTTSGHAGGLSNHSMMALPQLRKCKTSPHNTDKSGSDAAFGSRLFWRNHTGDSTSRTCSHKTVGQAYGCDHDLAALHHQYPVQFMIAVANTTRTIQKECKATMMKLLDCTVDGSTEACVSMPHSTALDHSWNEADIGIMQQAEAWGDVALDFLSTARLSIHTILTVVFLDIEPYLQRLFDGCSATGFEQNANDPLSTALATCHDYTSEISCIADSQVYTLFVYSLTRHLACCIACRMLLSRTSFDHSWQRQVHLEMSKFRQFVSLHMSHDMATAEQHLVMLSLLRALLCAPDAYTAVSSFTQISQMFGTLPAHFVYEAWEHETGACPARQRPFQPQVMDELEKIEADSMRRAFNGTDHTPSVMTQPRLAWLADVDESNHDDEEDNGMLMAAVTDMMKRRACFHEVPWNHLCTSI
eukprot:jgi/Ulvmu1/5081/UM021_0098.1